jgi:hypothetical protein
MNLITKSNIYFLLADDFGEALSSRIVATLFEIWLIACHKMFPAPSLWKTFQELCANWRHHISLVIEWNRVIHALTHRMLELLTTNNSSMQASAQPQPQWSLEPPTNTSSTRYASSSFGAAGTSSSSDTNVSYDIYSIIGQMSLETVIQAWFRFLHIIGRPVDFCDSAAIAKQLEIASRVFSTQPNQPPQPNQTPAFTCLKKLPVIYLEVMKGVSKIVDLFIVANQSAHTASANAPAVCKTSVSALTSVDQRLRSKSVYVTGSAGTIGTSEPPQAQPWSQSTPSSSTTLLSQIFRTSSLKSSRPNVNSLLHLAGLWLFEAALKPNVSDTSKGSVDAPVILNNNREFVLGQAEAYGILCRLFCSVKTNEEIMPEYLSRFYALLVHGLKVPANLGENMRFEIFF